MSQLPCSILRRRSDPATTSEEKKKIQTQVAQSNASDQAVIDNQRDRLIQEKRTLEVMAADLAAQKEGVEQLANARAGELLKQQEAPLRKAIQDELADEFKSKLTVQTQKSENQVKLVQDLQDQLIQLQKNNGTLESQRLELEREQATIRQRLETENVQKLVDGKTQAAKVARDLALQETELTVAQYKQKEDTLQKKLAELQRKLDQGSQQQQGETLEIELESRLSQAFRTDKFEEVAKGKSGADITQNIYVGSKFCGTIVWEAKRTKNWSNAWIQKLKTDQRAAGADLAILVTEAAPPGEVSQIDGVFICGFKNADLAGTVAREIVVKSSQARAVSEGRVTKAEEIYNLITSEGFHQVYQSNLKAIEEMRKATGKLRNSMNAYLSGQETQLQRLESNFAGMYGSFQAITQGDAPTIAGLELIMKPGIRRSPP